jgi:hypothetical protein
MAGISAGGTSGSAGGVAGVGGGVAGSGAGGASGVGGAGGSGSGGGTVVACDPWTRFRPPVFVYGLNREKGTEFRIHVSPDELTAYVAQGAAWDVADIYMAKRVSMMDPFGQLVPLTSINSNAAEDSLSVTGDGLTLFLESSRSGSGRIYTAVRLTTAAQFPPPIRLMLGQDPLDELDPYVLPDGSALYFLANLPVNAGIYRAELSGTQAGEPKPILTAAQRFPVVPQDELTLYFDDGGGDIWMATRASRAVAFDAPVKLVELNSAGYEYPQWISPDGCRLYFSQISDLGTFSMVAERASR